MREFFSPRRAGQRGQSLAGCSESCGPTDLLQILYTLVNSCYRQQKCHRMSRKASRPRSTLWMAGCPSGCDTLPCTVRVKLSPNKYVVNRWPCLPLPMVTALRPHKISGCYKTKPNKGYIISTPGRVTSKGWLMQTNCNFSNHSLVTFEFKRNTDQKKILFTYCNDKIVIPRFLSFRKGRYR